MTRSQSDLRQMVAELLDLESGLSPWEVEFLEGLAKTTTFTWKQAEKIEEIWDQRIGGTRSGGDAR